MSSSPNLSAPGPRRVRRLLAIVVGALALMLVSAGSASAGQYWLHQSKTAPNTHCYGGYGYVDLLPTLPGGTSSTAFTGGSRFACTQPFPAGAQLGEGTGTLEAYFTNTNKKPCTTSAFLNHQGARRTPARTSPRCS